jgi:hypothetical protein
MENEPLSDEELKAVRELLEAERRMRWLRSNLRVWATYLAGGVLTGFAVWKAITEYVQIKVGIK